jgi:hypothetical protein
MSSCFPICLQTQHVALTVKIYELCMTNACPAVCNTIRAISCHMSVATTPVVGSSEPSGCINGKEFHD